MRFREKVSAAAKGVFSLFGVRELVLFCGLGLYAYGRYLEVPTRAFVELGVVLVLFGVADHLPLWIDRFRRRGKS